LDTPEEALVGLFPDNREPGTYCVEISEQQFVGDPSCLQPRIGALKEAGIQVGLDDVGFGRSSLESLILFQPQIIKIDRNLVFGVSRDPTKRIVLERLVKVTTGLGAKLVAEGIESVDDLEVIQECGITEGQGFLWGTPK